MDQRNNNNDNNKSQHNPQRINNNQQNNQNNACQSSPEHPLRRRQNLPEYQNYSYPSLIPDQQAPDAAFSSLNLSPAPPLNPAGESLPLPPSPSDNVSLRNLRFQDGQRGSGVGPHDFPMGRMGPPSASLAAAFRNDMISYRNYRDWLYRELELYAENYSNYLNNTEQLNSMNQYPQIQPFPVRGSLYRNPASLLGESRRMQAPQQFSFLNLSDFKGRLVLLAKDQFWSSVLQSKFVNPSRGEIEMVLSEVIESIGDLMCHQFGSHFVQKIVGVCNDEQRNRILVSITANFRFIAICLSPYGTRGVQKLMENITSPWQISLIVAVLSPCAAMLANDPNGHHVIKYCVTHFSTADNTLLLNNITDNCYAVATNTSGCRVMQICVESCEGKPRERLVSEIIANALHLSESPYGNYVLQHMLMLSEPDIVADFVNQLEGDFLTISCNKYGSNVAERCLTVAGEEQSTKIIMELVSSPNASKILLDPFGNYVAQKALDFAKGHARNALLRLVRANVSYMRSNLYGQKVLSFLEKKKIQLV